MWDQVPELIVRLFVGGLLLAGFWYALRPKYVFSLHIQGGCIRTSRGLVTRSFVQQVESICRQAAIAHGQIYGLRRGRSIALAFSGSIPADCRQQLRNLWLLYGSPR